MLQQRSRLTHLDRHVELVLARVSWECGSGAGLDRWARGLKCHLGEPNFEHHLDLQQGLEVFLTAGEKAEGALMTMAGGASAASVRQHC